MLFPQYFKPLSLRKSSAIPGVWLRHWRMEFMKHCTRERDERGEGGGGEGMG